MGMNRLCAWHFLGNSVEQRRAGCAEAARRAISAYGVAVKALVGEGTRRE